ncbi:MAG: peptidase M14, partial [Flavobacteriales bacterium]|nr:peptidase M14 [Flavobacteriales bacterium]
MELERTYNSILERRITSRLIKHSDVKNIAQNLSDTFTVEEIGNSVLGKEIFSIKFGQGKRNILLWSQMHGNEPTATAAIFDILNYFEEHINDSLVSKLSKDFTFTFIPMLNPDGAKAWTRVNALNIDLNRDAVVKQAPESKILWNILEELNPEYSFNLHDQRNIFNVGDTNKTATISFLSASFDETRDMNNDRALVMSLIAGMNDAVQELIPGCVGRYTDEFYPTATGDNLHKLGYKNILIESGTYPGDPERQITRKANFVAIIKAFELISEGVKPNRADDYNSIPNNGKKFFDLIIRNVSVSVNKIENIVDLGIMYNEKPDVNYSVMEKHSKIENIGDLSQYLGLKEIDALEQSYSDDSKNYAKLNQEAT